MGAERGVAGDPLDVQLVGANTPHCHAYRERPGWLVLGIGLAATVGALINTYSAARFDDLLDGTVFRGRRPPLRIGRDIRLFVVFVGSLLNLPLATLAFLALLMNGEVVRRAVILRTRIR